MARILALPPGSQRLLLIFGIMLVSTAVQATTSTTTEDVSSHPDFHLSPDSEMTYEEELKLFEKEEAKEKPSDKGEHLSRKKRFVYLNVDTNMAVALLVSLPLTFVLPSMSNLFGSWRRKRSIDDSTLNSWTISDDTPTKPEMDKVNTYFQLLNIPEPSCQLRAVCEFSADPEKFYPLSDVILKRIRNPHLPALVYLEGQQSNSTLLTEGRNAGQTSLFDMYNQAADYGQINGYDKCIERYESTCHYPVEKLLNMPVVRFWNALQTLLKVSFRDVALK